LYAGIWDFSKKRKFPQSILGLGPTWVKFCLKSVEQGSMSEETNTNHTSGTAAKAFEEIILITDENTWVPQFIQKCVTEQKRVSVRLPSSVPLRPSWNRFKHSEPIVIHWESKHRSGGAIVEEILDIAPKFNVGERIIVLTTNPTHEDVVYFSELGIRRIIRLRARDKDLEKAALEFAQHFQACQNAAPDTSRGEAAWRHILQQLDSLPKNPESATLDALQATVDQLNGDTTPTARYLDACAHISAHRGNNEGAVKLWQQALDKNPNYFRAYHGIIRNYRATGRLREALALMQKMQEMNRSNISRTVGIGEVLLELEDDKKAEHYFRSALERDSFCSGALNGLAEIKFRQGDLDESRKLLSRSHLAYRAAAKLNNQGIDMVRKNQFDEALKHYTKAQYVLPQQEKGPLLFYNIGLCYARWGKPEMAREFLKLALIKEPNYKKARHLLTQIDERFGKQTAA